MKSTLAYDKQKQQYRCDIGQPQRRFLLGADPVEAAKRKTRLGTLWENIRNRGGWTDEHLAMAKAIAAGKPIKIATADSPNPAAAEKAAVEKLAGIDAPIQPTVQLADYHAATIELQNERIAELEKLIRERLGPAAVGKAHPRATGTGSR